MSGEVKTFRERIDRERVRELERRELPRPIDALNLVTFADEVSYRWYGLLLFPRLAPAGAWPVWVATHERSIVGPKNADEIVIVRYPNHRVIVRAIKGRYYGWVNRLREKGVRYFEFSLTERVFLDAELGRAEMFVVAQFNLDGAEKAGAVHEAVASDGRRLVYASREVSDVAIFSPMLPSDPNPMQYKHTAVFALSGPEAARSLDEGPMAGRIEQVTGEVSLQLYRRLPSLEALPWSRRRMDRSK
ncbi:MAG TPA: hypothetical protein VM658_03065 [bacterium]|nr:hypothetical protein [bacterium]